MFLLRNLLVGSVVYLAHHQCEWAQFTGEILALSDINAHLTNLCEGQKIWEFFWNLVSSRLRNKSRTPTLTNTPPPWRRRLMYEEVWVVGVLQFLLPSPNWQNPKFPYFQEGKGGGLLVMLCETSSDCSCWTKIFDNILLQPVLIVCITDSLLAETYHDRWAIMFRQLNINLSVRELGDKLYPCSVQFDSCTLKLRRLLTKIES